MLENIKQFSINDIQSVYTEDSDEFFYAKIVPMSTYPNSHRNPISKEVLMEYGSTILGKWVICDYQFGDATTHTNNQKIVGIIPPTSKIEYVEHDDGNVSMVVDAVLSKIYAPEIWEMFKNKNFRNVSCEFLAKEGETLANGDTPIEAFDIKGITILGKKVKGSIPNANMEVYKFSEENADIYYKEFSSKSTLKSFVEKRKEDLKLESHPINKSKGSLDEGNWNGDKAKHDLIKEKNYKTLAKSVCLLLEEGWEDRKITSLKYPVMNIKDGKWVYNAEGLSSALAYSAQHDESVHAKVIAIQKKLGIYKEEEMAKDTKNFSESETNDKDEHIVMEEEKQEDKVEEMAEQPKEEEMGCGEEMSEDESDDKKDEEEDKEEPEETEKKFSLDGYADMGAILTLLEKETEQNIALAKEVMTEMSAEDIVLKYVAMSKELSELKEFKEKIDKAEIDKKFTSIMATVKEDLDAKTFAELQEEGKQLNMEQLGAFENKVKAFAYEATKGTKSQSQELLVFGMPDEQSNNSSESVDDIYKKYL